MTAIDRLLDRHRDELGLARRDLDGGWVTVLLTPRFVTSRHVVALVHAPGHREPTLVAKVPRQPGDNGGVLREAAVLRQLTGLTEQPMGVPEIVGVVNDGMDTVLVETALTGRPLDPDLVAQDMTNAVRAGSEFIERLPITAPAGSNVGWYQREVAAPLAALAELVDRAGGVPGFAELCDRTHQALGPLRDADLPAVFEHGDMSHPNLLLGHTGELQVVDWERARQHGVPGHDLVFFLQYLSECERSAYTRDRQVEACTAAFAEGGWARAVLEEHLRRRGVDPGLGPAVILATWARSATTLADRLTEPGASVDAGPRAMATAVTADRDYWLWRHALDLSWVHRR